MNKLRTLILALLMSGAAHGEEPVVEVESAYPFGETLARLRTDGNGHVLVGYHPVSRLAAAQTMLERAIATTH